MLELDSLADVEQLPMRHVRVKSSQILHSRDLRIMVVAVHFCLSLGINKLN